MRRRSNVTPVLVGLVLVVVLYMAGRSVTPPPAAPPAPPAPAAKAPPAPPAPQPTATSDKLGAKLEAEKTGMGAPPGMPPAAYKKMLAMKGPHGKVKSQYNPNKFDPNTIQVNDLYWHQAEMGRQGEVQMRKKVAAALSEEARHPVVPIKSAPPPPQRMPAPGLAPSAGAAAK